MLNDIITWIKSFFVVPVEKCPVLITDEVMRVEVRKESAKEVEVAEEPSNNCASSLPVLLADLDNVFEQLKIPNYTLFTSKETRAGLTKMGPMVIPSDTEWAEKRFVEITPGKELPGMMFVAVNWEKHILDDPDKVHPSFFYAVKQERLPSECRHLKGVVYEVGMAYRFTTGKMGWVGMYATVEPVTGRVDIARYKQSKIQLIKHKRHRFSDAVETTFNKKVWGMPEIVNEWAAEAKKDANIYAKGLGESFAAFFNTWQRREDHWRVSVRKDKRRMTFQINKADPKTFFKDRGITALTPTGQKKKIMHFVQSHLRLVGKDETTTVKEHIRGLRQFEWKGYSCSILSPQFHKFDSDTFTAAAVYPEDHDEMKFISLERGARLMAEMEDSQSAPPKRAYSA